MYIYVCICTIMYATTWWNNFQTNELDRFGNLFSQTILIYKKWRTWPLFPKRFSIIEWNRFEQKIIDTRNVLMLKDTLPRNTSWNTLARRATRWRTDSPFRFTRAIRTDARAIILLSARFAACHDLQSNRIFGKFGVRDECCRDNDVPAHPMRTRLCSAKTETDIAHQESPGPRCTFLAWRAMIK